MEGRGRARHRCSSYDRSRQNGGDILPLSCCFVLFFTYIGFKDYLAMYKMFYDFQVVYSSVNHAKWTHFQQNLNVLRFASNPDKNSCVSLNGRKFELFMSFTQGRVKWPEKAVDYKLNARCAQSLGKNHVMWIKMGLIVFTVQTC